MCRLQETQIGKVNSKKKKRDFTQKKVQTEIEELIGTGRRNMKINHRPKLEKYTINNDILYSIIYCKLVNIHIHIHTIYIYIYIYMILYNDQINMYIEIYGRTHCLSW